MTSRNSIFILLSLCSVPAFGQGWTDLPGTHLTNACPTGALAVPGSCAAVVYAWSSAVADTQRNRLIIWGGGHNDYYGNEVYALNLSANPVTLTRLNNPSPPASNSDSTKAGCVNALSDGAANGRHTYNGLAYISSADRMLAFGGVHSCLYGGFYGDLWTLSLNGLAANPGQNNWTAEDPVNGASGNQPTTFYLSQPSVVVYDPSSDLTYIGQSTLGYWWSYKYSTNTYTLLTKSSPVPFTATAVLYPPTKTIYFFGSDSSAGSQAASTAPPQIYKMSIASGSNYAATNITSSTSGCTGLAGAMSPGVAYDSALNKIVGWPNFGNTVYIFDPTTNTCTSQTFPGGPPDSVDYNGAQYTTGTYGRFQYFPALDAFAVVNSATSDAYLLRLSSSSSGSGSSSAPPSLPVISSFTASSASITSGSPVTLSWTTSGATSVSISPAPGSVALSGSSTVTPAATTTYTLTATNSTGSQSATVSVAVTAPVSSGPTISSFTATPNSVSAGQAATLSWVTSGATSITISPGSFSSASGSGSTSVSPSSTTNYTLTASNGSASTTAQVSVAVSVSSSSTPISSTASDTMTITNASSTTTSNYPVQIGRPFVQGEFPNGQLPQAFLGSAALPTQVDVKNRWPDGSLKHALLSFLLPTFVAGQSYTISFQAGTTVGNTALTQAQMLGSGFNFDAQIQLTSNGATKSASARTMLNNGDYTVWASGPIATTIILANHAQTTACGGNAASKYDFGFDAYCAFRPEFEATFWPGTNQVFVRYIGEVANTEQLENVVVNSVVLTIGSASPSTVYTLPASLSPLTMGALTRWTLSYWLNGTPPAAGYNHNLAYLAATKLIPNYDTSRVIAASQVGTAYTKWQSLATSNPYSPADFTQAQSAVGGRNYPADEIGPLTGPEVMWLYSGDYRAQQMAIRYAELSSAWPVHFREGKAGKYIDRAKTISGVGHWLSVSGRPSYCIECGSTYFNYSSIAAADRITPVGNTTYGCVNGGNSGWCPNVAHEPDWMPVYLLTGDYYFLEEDWAWASYTTASIQASPYYSSRGPTGAEGHIPGNSVVSPQVRGSGWALRNRVETEAVSPDSSPEQGYYDLLIKDTLAAWEGEREITTGAYNGTPMWKWGNQWGNADATTGNCWLWCFNAINGVKNGVPTAIHFWVPDGGVSNNLGGYPEKTSIQPAVGSTSPWMVQYVIYALGRAKDLGYPSQALLSWIAPWIIDQVTDPTFNPYLVSMYRQPTVQANGQYFTKWSDILATVCTSTSDGCVSGPGGSNAQTAQTFNQPISPYGDAFDPNGDGVGSSAFEAGMAIAQVADQPNGDAAWNWIYTNAMTNSALNINPKWDIIPRGASSSVISSAPPPAPVTSACDLNGDGVVNQADVTLAVNQALGTAPCTNANLQNNGQCTVVDVQRIINASLGQGCKTGN